MGNCAVEFLGTSKQIPLMAPFREALGYFQKKEAIFLESAKKSENCYTRMEVMNE